jgi:hypothetical protein
LRAFETTAAFGKSFKRASHNKLTENRT